MLTVVCGEGSGHEGTKDHAPSLIDEIVREGARRMLAGALQAEVDAYIARFSGEREGEGRRLVVRNGYHQPREILTSAGAIEVTVPPVKAFEAAYARNSPRPSRRSPMTWTSCLCSATAPPSTGCICARPVRSSQLSRRPGTRPGSPRAPARGLRAWR